MFSGSQDGIQGAFSQLAHVVTYATHASAQPFHAVDTSRYHSLAKIGTKGAIVSHVCCALLALPSLHMPCPEPHLSLIYLSAHFSPLMRVLKH